MQAIRYSSLLFVLLLAPTAALARPADAATLAPDAATCARTTVASVKATCDKAERKALRRAASERRAAKRVERWAERKQMCRELGVRFDRSGLCW